MNKSLALLALLAMGSAQANAYPGQWKAMPPLSFRVDSMPTSLSSLSSDSYDAGTNHTAPKPEISKWAAKGKEADIKPYKFKDDMTYAGVPLFIAGIIAKSEKASFRQDYNNANSRTRLVTNFHNEIDNYTQYVPMALAAGLNFAGVDGRSDTWRFLASGAMSYALMAAIVNPIKYSAKEMRPDGSTRNSWPSGHTATAFVGATILHKEYGLTRSPWYSVAGYGLATATGVMRVLNNRHWVSDVLSGAGIGILSTELAYGFSDLIFKGKHLKRNDLLTTADIIEHPSFFSISMGIGLGNKNLTFSGEDLEFTDENGNPTNINLKFSSSTVVGAEGAYFLNKYVGLGGRLRVKSSPIKGWDKVANKEQQELEEAFKMFSDEDINLGGWIPTHDISIESDHITEFSADLGVYFNFPLSNRFAIGTKLLVGRSIIQDLDVNGHFAGNSLWLNKSEGTLDFKKGEDGQYLTYDTTWDYLTVSGNNTTKYGTGISLTYAYKSNFSWKLFADYDYTRKHYTMEYDPTRFMQVASPDLFEFFQSLEPGLTDKKSSTTKKNMNSFVLGCAFTVSF